MTENRVRIIGGQWRSRWVEFAPDALLRPTPSRVRETLFNWLMPFLPAATCLDAFAGSGALGFEALSRGASQVTFFEKSPGNIRQLRHNATRLQTQAATIACVDTMQRFQTPPAQPFDVIFLDPPYDLAAILPCLQAIQQNGWLAPQGFIYIEHNHAFAFEAITDATGLVVHRSSRAAQVYFALLRQPIPQIS